MWAPLILTALFIFLKLDVPLNCMILKLITLAAIEIGGTIPIDTHKDQGWAE